MAMVRQSSPNSAASRSPSRVLHREPQTTCGQKTLVLYTANGYVDQQTKKFVRRGRNACLEELKEKYGVKISGSTLDRIVRMGKEAKGCQVCFVRKKYDDGKDDVRVDMVQQPTNSPDTNIWNIGAFNAHQKEFKKLEAFTNINNDKTDPVVKCIEDVPSISVDS